MINKHKVSFMLGFTVIELMIAVAIVAVIAVASITGYEGAILKSSRSEAKSKLLDMAQFMERNFTINNCYHRTDSNCVAGWVAGDAGSVSLPIVQDPATAKYIIGFQGLPTANAFTLEAVPANNQVGDLCGTLALNQIGQKVAAQPDCW